jgi:hypothetical protein
MTTRRVANQQTYGDTLSKKGKKRAKLCDISFFLKSVGFWQIFTQKND